MMTTTAHDLRNCFLIFHSSVRLPSLATTWSLQSSLFISISDTIYFAWLCSCSPLYQSLMGSLLLAKSHFIQSRVRMTSPQTLSSILSLFLPLHHPPPFPVQFANIFSQIAHGHAQTVADAQGGPNFPTQERGGPRHGTQRPLPHRYINTTRTDNMT